MINIHFPTLFRFMAVGGIGVFINEGILIAVHGYLGFPLLVGNILAFESALVCQFQVNDRWTFKSASHVLPGWKRFLSYQCMSLGSLVINFSVLYSLSSYAGIDYRIANIIGIFIAFGWNFWMNYHVTWKSHHR